MEIPTLFEVRTQAKNQWIDITSRVEKLVSESGIQEGTCVIFVPHTTAALTLNENADPDVPRDLELAMNRISPDLKEFRHAEGNSAAHVKTSLTGPSLTLIVHQGRLLLGTWQAVWFTEFDGPRTRKCYVRVS